MRSLFLFILISGLLVAPAAAEKDVKSENSPDTLSYSLGFRMGADFSKFGVVVDPQILADGLKDALKGAKPKISDSEMRVVLTNMQKRIAAQQQKQMGEMAEKNLKEGQAFLEKNKKEKGVVTLTSGLQYKVLTKGKGPSPKATDKVKVNYRGTLIDGTEFDSSYSRGEPATFQANRVIKGWVEALQLMQPGAKWQLFIPANLAYGPRAAGPRIPPNSTLIFEVELLEINPETKQ